MDSSYYRDFLVLLQERNFNSAAELLHISQPALRKRAIILQEYFGMPLIITSRGKQGFRITDAGKAVAKYALEAIALEQDFIKQFVKQFRTDYIEALPPLQLSASDVSSNKLLEIPKNIFSLLYPAVEIKTTILDFQEQKRQLIDGLTELGICHIPPEQIKDGLEPLIAIPEKFVAVFSKGNSLLNLRKNTISLKELICFPMALAEDHRLTFKKLYKNFKLKPKFVEAASSLQSVLNWISAENGVGIFSENIEALKDQLDDSKYICLKIKGINSNPCKTIFKVKDRPLSKSSELFLSFLVKIINCKYYTGLDANIKHIQW